MSNLSKVFKSKNASILSIAIPVYKRPELLSCCLESVILAVDRFSVPIYIYDDSLSDLNKLVIDAARDKYSLIFHVVNDSNLGIDENIAKCVESTNSEYVWLLGEDDLLVFEAIESALNTIQKYHSYFIFSNYSYISNDYTRIIRERRLDFDHDCLIKGVDFFESYLWAAGFIGGCIISTKAWSGIDRSKYKGTYFSHVGVIAELIHKESVPIMCKPLVKNRAENLSSTSWGAQSFEVNFGWDSMLATAGQLFGDNSLRLAKDSSSIIFWHRSILFLMSKRADGIYKYSVYVKHILHNNFSCLFKINAALILLVPKNFFGLVKNIRNNLKVFFGVS